MKVKDIMHKDPVCCTSDDTLQSVARMMIDCDCGAIPVVENQQAKKLVGMITDRDIVCRAVAQGKSPEGTKVSECLSDPAVSVTPETTMKACVEMLEKNQIRRMPVVDEQGVCCGVVTQAQIARNASTRQTAQLLRDVSRKTETPSAVLASR